MKSLGKISVQAPYETSLGKMSLYKISRFVRACAVETHMDMSSKPFGSRIYRKCRAPEVCRTFCASLRIRNAHGHVTRGILCGILQGKCRTLIPRPAFCASLRSRNAHGHVTKGISRGNSEGKCWTLPIPPRLHPGPYLLPYCLLDTSPSPRDGLLDRMPSCG
jgi:hypothetical protein